MKIYSKIIWDKDFNILDEESFEYNGPIAECGGITRIFNPPSPPPPPPVELPETVKGAMAVIEKKRQGAEPDVDLAEKIPEDIPKAWTEPATEDVVKDSDLPSIVEPLTARSDKETEATIKEREKRAGETELFPEPLKSTNVQYSISDIS